MRVWKTMRASARPLALLAALAIGGSALAAGGHHALDDANMVDPGACEVEGWLTGARAGDRLLHAGAACRVGPVEIGVAAERVRQDGARDTAWQAQLKWATEVAPRLNAGISIGPAWQAQQRPRYQGVTVLGLATWTPRADWAFHMNLGRDIARSGPGENRGGLSAEWLPGGGWSFTAERYREQGTHFARAGARWSINDEWTVDLSRAQRLQGPAPSTWTLGMLRRFGA